MIKAITRWFAPSLESLCKEAEADSVRDVTIVRRNGKDCVTYKGLTVSKEGDTPDELLVQLARMREEYVARRMEEEKHIHGYD